MNWARLRYPGTAGPRPVAPLRTPVAPLRAPVATPDRGPLNDVFDLQATAGNLAVASILASAHAQRDTAGWTGADTSGQGWNVKARDVDKIRRVPIEGLKLGGGTAFVGDERKKTIESAEHRAIVLIPTGMKVGTSVDVMLHFHGWTHRAVDPHAGWRQHSGPDATVRDVDQDRIEAQLQAAGTQLVAILPQGVGESQFGKVPIEPYIKEVLGKVTAVNEFKDAKGNVVTTAPGLGRLVLSGHSGGGNVIMPALGAGAGKEPAEVILFEAIHHVGKFDAPAIVGNWATRHLEAVRKVLAATAPPPSPADRAKAIDACPRLRAYYSDYSGGKFDPKRKRRGYETNYERLAGILDAWFAKHGKDLGGDLAAVRARFKVQPLTGTGHETVVRGLGDDPFAGPLTDALVALDNPQAKSKLVTSGTTTWTRPRRAKPPTKKGPAKPKIKPKPPKPTPKPKGASIEPTPTSGTGSRSGTAIATTSFGATEIVAALDRAGVGNPTITALLPMLLLTGEPLKVAATVFAMAGVNDDVDLTDALFDIVHRELEGEQIAADRDDLKAEWRTLRRDFAAPALAQLRDTPSADRRHHGDAGRCRRPDHRHADAHDRYADTDANPDANARHVGRDRPAALRRGCLEDVGCTPEGVDCGRLDPGDDRRRHRGP